MDSRSTPQRHKDPPFDADRQLGSGRETARELETEIDPEREKVEARREFTLPEAVETFLGDQKARGLGKETQKKYRGSLSASFWPGPILEE